MEPPETHDGNTRALNHPPREEWMEYLYRELDPARQRALEAHLGDCRECQEALAAWQRAGTALDAWELPPAIPAARPGRFPVRWAIAALFVFGLGYIAAQLSAVSSADREAIGRQLARELRPALEKELSAKLRADLQRALDQARADTQAGRAADPPGSWLEAIEATARSTMAVAFDRSQQLVAAAEERNMRRFDALNQTIEKLESRQQSDYAAMRRDLETLAVLTQESFQRAQQQLIQLAGYTLPSNEHLKP